MGGERRRSERRADGSDAPFGPEEALFGWLPRAGAAGFLLLALALLFFAWRHHDDYRLIPRDGGASLERGVFAPWGWDAWTPEASGAAWASVPWALGDDAPPLEGELGDLADVFADLLTEQVEASLGDPAALAAATTQLEAFAAWYSSEFGHDPEPAARARALLQAGVETQRSHEEAARAAEEAEAEARKQAVLADEAAATEAERELARVRAHSASRRSLLIRVEEFLDGLPPAGEGTLQEEADRAALETFVRTMDTPLPAATRGLPPGDTP